MAIDMVYAIIYHYIHYNMLKLNYPLVNKLFDPENHQCLMVSLIFQPR